MNNIKKVSGKREIVVFDSVLATYPGGIINIDATDAKTRFTDGIIPAGTLIVPNGNGGYKILNAALTATNVKGALS